MRSKIALATIVAFAVIMGFSVLGPAFAQPELKMYICHKVLNGEPHTIIVAENAWKAHEKHGDAQGPCSEEDLK